MNSYRNLPFCVAIVLAVATADAQTNYVYLDALGQRGTTVIGSSYSTVTHPYYLFGRRVAGAGDMNGDGLGDIVIGAPKANRDDSGRAFVVFGDRSPSTLHVEQLTGRGFAVRGKWVYSYLGYSVSGGGDANGDGYSDLLLGSDLDAPIPGEAYTLFGRPDSRYPSLHNLVNSFGPDAGYLIYGSAGEVGWNFGLHVTGAGDVNGDGASDSVVCHYRGPCIVIFGRSEGTVSLDTLVQENAGFEIGIPWFTNVTGLGDVNGDGLADIGLAREPNSNTGLAYVVFGKADSEPVHVFDMGPQGFIIDHLPGAHGIRFAIAGAGDVNGDGLADIIVTDRSTSASLAGDYAAVIYGKGDNQPVYTAQLGAAGFRIGPIHRSVALESLVRDVAGAGDVNGDGYGDVIVASLTEDLPPYHDPQSQANAPLDGVVHVIFGAASNADVDTRIRPLGARGFSLRYSPPQHDPFFYNEWLPGYSVSSAGDFNGDGFSDVVLSAPVPYAHSGKPPYVHVVYGENLAPPLQSHYLGYVRGGDAPEYAFGDLGDGSTHGTPSGRAWIDYADGFVGRAGVSKERVVLNRSSRGLPNPGARVSWKFATKRLFNSAKVTVKYLDSELIDTEDGLILYHATDPRNGPFTALRTTQDKARNRLSAHIESSGFVLIGKGRTLAN